MSSYRRRVVFGFGKGATVGLFGIIVLGPALGLLVGLSPYRHLSMPIMAVFALVFLFLDGWVGGASLGMGRRAALGYGIGFVPLGLLLPLALIAPQAFPARENLLKLLPLVGITFGIGFVLAGVVGARIARLGPRVTKVSVLGFGIGGVIGGVLTMAPFVTLSSKGGVGIWGIIMVFWSVLLGVFIPHLIGGAVLGTVVEPLLEAERREEKDS